MRYFFYSLFFILFLTNCTPSFDEPEIDLDSYHIEEGFTLEAVASEPFIEAPVAIDFDHSGRIWVVEMRGYMQNIEGLNEDMPNGRIVILEDLDNDGVIDHHKVFLDSLVLPRALALVYGGLLYSEPPNLWFVEIDNDTPGKRTLVDSLYAEAGNVEHQPNGLLLNIDNWIYNAKSNFRYRFKNNQWRKEATSFRGQWGIAQDNFGRLYYNHNSALLLGDLFLPNVIIQNKNYSPSSGVGKLLTETQEVFPLHASLVNRGYQDGILNEDSILINATSACGPTVYRGQSFGSEFNENAFVCIPEGNLIKRLVLKNNGFEATAEPFSKNSEFLASADEGFRPVNLKTGPDGALYIVDMHRGIIQHAAYMTTYLRQQLKEKQLDTILGMGRILKVKKQGHKTQDPNYIKWDDPVSLLAHPNGWVRDKAQHLIVYQNQVDKIPSLTEVALDYENPLSQLHALRALEGIGGLSYDLVEKVALKSNADVVAHCLLLAKEFASVEHLAAMESLIKQLVAKTNPQVDLYLGHSLGTWARLSQDFAFTTLNTIDGRYQGSDVIKEAITSGLDSLEIDYLDFLVAQKASPGSMLSVALQLAITNKEIKTVNSIFINTSVHEDDRTTGLKLYRKICANCHGSDGAGIVNLAPPLLRSEYVKGPVEQLGLIILHGLKGPITVDGKLYELSSVMPGLITNQDISDEDISAIINYLLNAFSRESLGIRPELIEKLRKEKPKDGTLYTDEELKARLSAKTLIK